ncbi:MAG: hypothetical protein Q9168_006120, partial [Polycauliona sp. 1 TL-2023]
MATLTHLLNSETPPEDPAIIISGPGTEPVLTITHQQLLRQCKALQQQLAQIGIGHGLAVSISLPNSYEFVAVFLAICWQRAVAAPLNPAYKEQEVLFYVHDLDAKAIVVPKGACEKQSPAVLAARESGAAVIECSTTAGGDIELDVKEMGASGGKGAVDVDDAREDDIALVLHTSGTTGKPKA